MWRISDMLRILDFLLYVFSSFSLFGLLGYGDDNMNILVI